MKVSFSSIGFIFLLYWSGKIMINQFSRIEPIIFLNLSLGIRVKIFINLCKKFNFGVRLQDKYSSKIRFSKKFIGLPLLQSLDQERELKVKSFFLKLM